MLSLVALVTLALISPELASGSPFSQMRRSLLEEQCLPGVWGCKRGAPAALNEQRRTASEESDEQCLPGVWGCKKRTVIQERQCLPGVWGCKRGFDIPIQAKKKQKTPEECPPGLWGCKRGFLGGYYPETSPDYYQQGMPSEYSEYQQGYPSDYQNLASYYKRRLAIRMRRSVEKEDEQCLPGVWGCKKDKIEAKKSEDQCLPGVWGCKRDKIAKKQAEEQCPPGLWGCKKDNIEIEKTEETKKSEDQCLPGVWGCKKRSVTSN
ncbi:LWamide neuropeptides [Nematostella vectensis]|nr:LWamide neuropeptides [Nematostella vectensis]XP_032239630.1 LWamide neuropeptides [Nematostella vectensis]XP_048583863.1 LWamide neuropeptides [Nematostella vectensis]XP_048583864.1 LWamide neuropeptides [Nematostella vectensis]